MIGKVRVSPVGIALEGLQHQVAHVVDVSLDPSQTVVIDLSVFVAAFFDTGALGFEFLFQFVQQCFIGEGLAGGRADWSAAASTPDRQARPPGPDDR